MAQKIVAEVVLDAGESIKQTQKIEENLAKIDKQIDEINSSGTKDFDKTLADLNKTVDSGELSIRELTKSIKQYETIAIQAGTNSPVGKEALLRAAQLTDEIGDLRASVNNLAKDGQALQTALQLGSGITAGYTAFKSVTALVGVENEALMETMVKLQAAQAALVSIEQIRATLEKQSLVTLKAKDFWNKAVAFSTMLFAKAQAGATTATAGATVGVRAFTAALIATGIGAIIVGIGMLIAYFDQVAAAAKWVANETLQLFYRFQELGVGVKILISIFFPFIGIIWAVTEALEAMGVVESVEARKSREAIEAKMKIATAAHDKRVDEIRKQIALLKEQAAAEKAATDLIIKNIDREIELRRAAGESVKELEAEKLNILVQSARQQYNIAKTLLELQDEELFARRQHMIELAKIQGKNTDELEKALNFEKRQRAMIIEENLSAEKEALDQALHNLKVFHVKQEFLSKQSKHKTLEDAKELQDEYDDSAYKALLDRLAKEEQATEAYRLRQLNARQKAEDDLRTRLYNELELAGENNELKLLLEEEFQKNMKAIDDDYAEQAKKQEDDRIAAQKKAEKELLDMRLAMTSSYFQGVSALADAFSKGDEKRQRVAFKIKKAADIASATIDGTKAVLSAFAQTPGGVGIKSAAAAAAGVFAAAQIAKIAQTEFGGGATSDMAATIQEPTMNASIGGANNQNVGTNTNTDPMSLLNGGGMQPVLVVDSFTAVQNDLNKVTAMGTLG
jgi:hypothetical protein